MDIFAFVFDSGSLNNSVSKPTHQLFGLTIACHPLATCIFPCVLNGACIYVTKAKIEVSRNSIYQGNPKSSHVIDCVEDAARPACTLTSLFLYLNSSWEIQKEANSKTVFPNCRYTFWRNKVKKTELLSHLGKPKESWSNGTGPGPLFYIWRLNSLKGWEKKGKFNSNFTDLTQPLTSAQLATDETLFNYQLYE